MQQSQTNDQTWQPRRGNHDGSNSQLQKSHAYIENLLTELHSAIWTLTPVEWMRRAARNSLMHEHFEGGLSQATSTSKINHEGAYIMQECYHIRWRRSFSALGFRDPQALEGSTTSSFIQIKINNKKNTSPQTTTILRLKHFGCTHHSSTTQFPAAESLI